MNLGSERERADRLRTIPLESILRLSDARPDRYDRSKWHTRRGTLSITGAKFINWTRGLGGGGAIDLVIHLHGLPFKDALQWLDRHFPHHSGSAQTSSACDKPNLRLPSPQSSYLGRVRNYLNLQRALPLALIDRLIHSGTLYADRRANAVFLLLEKENIPVGAELRGTGPLPWRGMAPGSQKDLGYFSISPPAAPIASSAIILCESAIDALSCFALYPDHTCISTAGARPNPRWLSPLLALGPPIYCGFDIDDTGQTMAHAMTSLYPTIQRLRPTRHDWNDTLRSSR